MKSLRSLLFICIAVISGTLSAQSQRELGQLMRERGEYYFTLSVGNPTEIQSISEICSIDGTDGRNVVAYANQQEYNKLLQAGYQPHLQTPPSLREDAVMWQGGDRATYDWNSYLTYGDYVSMMEGFPTSVTNGANCTLVDLGTLSTTNHRRILGVRLNNGQPNGKPKFLYTSTMHGDEVTGMILMLRLINEFCTSTDSRIQNILNNVDLFIFPNTNPDGTYNGGNNTVTGAKRYNGNNVDLNRHFPDFDDGAHPDGASYYQDEAQWMMELAQEYLFTMGANYHGGAEVMNYPWDTYQPLHPDDAWWQHVSLEYVALARQANSSYMTDTESNGITNGYAWYTITGSRQDYMNYYGQCREITIECSSTKTPSASQLPNFWNYNHIAMLAYIEQCLNGVHGFVYDAVTGEPIEGVSVTVENHDALGSSVTSHTIGDFHRPIKGGTYTFTFAKQGYYSQSVQVTVADDDREDLTIYLEPNLNLDADFAASTTDVALGQSISFTDLSEGMVSSWNWTFEGATPSTSTEQNPTGITYSTAGDYDVTLTITGPTGNTQTVTKENYIHVADYILMQNGSLTTCSGLFYDSGGPNSSYGNNLNYTMTFYPGTEDASISVTFSQFNTESNYDYLYIYNGTSTSANLIGQYSGTTGPGTVTATNAEGALTFRFTSDSYTNAAGWVATVSCVERPEIPKNCYYLATEVSVGTYVMGCLDGTTLSMPSHLGSSTVTTTSANVSPTDYGFSEEEGAILPQVTLTAYGSNGQYYIQYNGKYLARSNNNGLTWGTSTSSSGRWYINSNGIYTTSNNRNYYLYYNNGSFTVSTTQQNNVTFYTQGDCPTEQAVTLIAGWNWWSTNLDITLDQLKDALAAAVGTNGTAIIKSQGKTITCQNGQWRPDNLDFDIKSMYQIYVNTNCEITLSGTQVNPSEYEITIYNGINWIGFLPNETMTLNEAFGSFPVEGDMVKSEGSSATYTGGVWRPAFDLEPGKGYIYQSNAQGNRTFTYGTNR
ncbi:MAG: carboxypeptidase regulatory-like domain-containing protein [Muribaculaceae bacterium]|nr:carboxypeptidase regulatory-like domain-containing protein [Muribaculaceae bacterium]